MQAENNPKVVMQLQNDLHEIVKHDFYACKMGIAGYKVEADDCFDHGIDDTKHCLYLVLDSFTNVLSGMHMEKEEINIWYLIALKGTFTHYGKPSALKNQVAEIVFL